MPFSQRKRYGKMMQMAKKKKERFNVTKAVKAASRENIGIVPATKRVPVKKKELAERYRSSLEKLLNEGE